MEILARAAIILIGTTAVVAGTYFDDDAIRPASNETTGSDRNRPETQ